MTLYAHQKAIIDDDPKKCGLWLGTGSGKSRIALSLARGKTLVVAPKTLVEDGNWIRENKNCNVDLTVISKETFRRDHETLPAYDTLIIDEAHTALGLTPNTRHRNKVEIPRASQLFEALQAYVLRTSPARVYLCTATITKSPMTVLAAGIILGKLPATIEHFFAFRNTFYTRIPMPGREVYVPKSTDATKDALATIVRSLGYVGRLTDYFDVPTQTYCVEHIELTPKQRDRIKKLTLEYPEPIVRVGKRHQVENGVLSGDEYSATELFENGKIERILDYTQEFPSMVVFARYLAQIDALRQALDRKHIPNLILTGATADRGGLLRQANNMDRCVFIAQSQISAGWELPEYPVMVFASMSYSVVDRVQAEGRILRANALKKNLYITLIVRGGVDEAVYKSIINKQDFNERLFGV